MTPRGQPRDGLGTVPVSPEVVAENLAKVRGRIERCGTDPDDVTIVAVTKGFTVAAVTAALRAGLLDIGENYADELIRKAQETSSGQSLEAPRARWHYLGAIQRRKVKELAPIVDCWQTVSRLSEGEEIVERSGSASVMVEIEMTGIPGRNGCAPESAAGLVGALGGLGLVVRGLMVVGPPGPAEGSRPLFRTAARLAADLGLRDLSMGMSDDLEVAVQEGATVVRIGRALFGERVQTVR